MAVTLCVPPRAGELCAPIRFLLRRDSTVIELTSRHRITDVQWDSAEGAVAMRVEITDPSTSRPVDIRVDIVRPGLESADPRSRRIGEITRDKTQFEIRGTYLGVVADEN